MRSGIDYTALNGGSEYRRMYQLPCFIKAGEKPGSRIHCEHFRAPTTEEIAQHRQSADDRQNLVMTVNHQHRSLAGEASGQFPFRDR